MQVKLRPRDRSNQWEEDYQLVQNAGLIEEYLEMGQFISKLKCIKVKLVK